MAEYNLDDIPSDEELFHGFPKIPYVLLERINLVPLLTNIKIKRNKNGKIVPYLVDKTKTGILRNMLRDCSVVLKNICPNNNNRVSKRNRGKNNDKNITKISNKSGKKPKTVKEHVRSSNKETNTNKKQYKCKKCNTHFNDHKSMKEHMNLKHTKQIYVCAHCSKKYVRRMFFKRHIGLHCEKCFTLQRNHLQYMEHITLCQNENIDENETVSQKFECDLCADEFNSKCAVTYHRVIKHSNSCPKELYMIRCFGTTKVYTCNFCEKCYDDKNLIESHVSVLQTISPSITNNSQILDDTSYIANNNVEEPQPQKISKDPVNPTLENVKQEEMASTNLNICKNASVDLERPPINNNRILRYHCKMCDKYFSTNFALIRHIKVHHILQSLSCNLCKQAFTESSLLLLHKCIEEPTEPISAKPETDTVCDPVPFIPPSESGKCNLPVVSNIRTLQKDLVYIVVREVPIEY